MVHALSEVHRVLAPGGILIDARPDSRVVATAECAAGGTFKRFGLVETRSGEAAIDRVSDRAVATAVRRRLFRSLRRGRFWYRVQLPDLAELRLYLSDHLRFVHRARWIVDRATLRRHAKDRFAIRRAVRFEIFRAM